MTNSILRRHHLASYWVGWLWLLCAGWSSQGIAADYSGRYQGDIAGTPSTLVLTQQGTTISGEIDAGGYRYLLEGQLSHEGFQGSFSDPATGGAGTFVAAVRGNRVNLQIELPGAGQALLLQFEKGNPGGGATPQPRASTERDPSLIGRWRYSESMVSGEFSGVVETFMSLHLDGSYRYGDGSFVGGGPGVGGSSSGGSASVGEWRTQDRIVYIREQGSAQWTPYARYYVEGGKMMLTFSDGSKQIWHRIQ